jgi:hypothetical protein
MKNAIIAAVVAALVSSGATIAATKISGRAIAKHSIPANRLTASAVSSFTAAPEPRAMAAAVSSTLAFQQTAETPVVADDSVTGACPAGDVAIVGGYRWTRGSGPVASSWRTSDGTGWQVQIGDVTSAPNDGGGPARIEVFVACQPA